MNMPEFARRLKAARKSRGLSAQQLGDATGIERSVIANIETGRRHSLHVGELVAIALALDVSATTLVPELSGVVPGREDNSRLRELLSEIAAKAVSA